jgi:hypothetical protein
MTDSSRVRLDAFRPSANRGASRTTEGLWYLVKVVFFLTAIPWPSSLKTTLLRKFGARVGQGVVIAPRVNVHMPWKVTIGDHSWIGEEVFLLSLEPITIGSNVCISQRSFLCAGNHDYTSPDVRLHGGTDHDRRRRLDRSAVLRRTGGHGWRRHSGHGGVGGDRIPPGWAGVFWQPMCSGPSASDPIRTAVTSGNSTFGNPSDPRSRNRAITRPEFMRSSGGSWRRCSPSQLRSSAMIDARPLPGVNDAS